MKIIGILILLVGSLIFLVGLGGAVMNFVFPPKEMTCETADEKMKAADVAVAKYQAAKGTPDEFVRKAEADRALKEAEGWNDSCGRSKDSHRFYGIIFSVVALVGGFIFLVGSGLTALGFRKKKLA